MSEDAKEDVRVPLVLSADFVKRIDAFRHKHWFPTRTATVRYLIDYALKQDPQPTEEEANA